MTNDDCECVLQHIATLHQLGHNDVPMSLVGCRYCHDLWVGPYSGSNDQGIDIKVAQCKLDRKWGGVVRGMLTLADPYGEIALNKILAAIVDLWFKQTASGLT